MVLPASNPTFLSHALIVRQTAAALGRLIVVSNSCAGSMLSDPSRSSSALIVSCVMPFSLHLQTIRGTEKNVKKYLAFFLDLCNHCFYEEP
jgi:hypothetical protein